MNDRRIERYEDLQLLVRMLQLARQRADLLLQVDEISTQLAVLRARCNPDLQRTLDGLTLIELAHANNLHASIAEEGPTSN